MKIFQLGKKFPNSTVSIMAEATGAPHFHVKSGVLQMFMQAMATNYVTLPTGKKEFAFHAVAVSVLCMQ